MDELPEYDINDLKGDYNPVDYFKYYRFLINAIVVGGPWALTAIGCFLYNLYFNIEWNRNWASGHWYLVVNTLYLAVQVVDSIFIVFELPVWLRAFRVTRILSFFTAIIYNTLYLLSAFEWWDMIYAVADKSNYDFVTVMINMLLGYNLVLHISVVPVNFAIILKEISLYFVDVGGKKRDNEESRYLDSNDIYYAERDLSPEYWYVAVLDQIFGLDFKEFFQPPK